MPSSSSPGILNGEKVKQDFEKAAYWYGKAAAQGLAPAQYRVATMYERGRGVGKDVKAALGWYERAASLGNVEVHARQCRRHRLGQ
ncbi:MAG: tetratricopeptide repeat protein [Hyphomicrobiales bacterium]